MTEVENELQGLVGRIPSDRFAAGAGVYAFQVGEDSWTLRITPEAAHVEAGAAPDAMCTLAASAETFQKLLARQLSPLGAVLAGQLEVRGDLSAAQRLQSLF
jgi:putative sterol carrier protein